jgi:hypothetical protein
MALPEIRAVVRALFIAAVVCLCLAATTGVAFADEHYRPTTLEGSPWRDAVRALQGNMNSEGTTLHVVVLHEETGHRVPCARYRFELDDSGLRAFEIGACDIHNHATAIRLTHRSALFVHHSAIAVRTSMDLTPRVTPRPAPPPV